MKKMMKKIFLLFVMLMICFATNMYSNAVRNCEKDGHFYVKAETIAPTCIKEGYTKYCCECGNYYYSNFVEARGHNFEMTYSIMPTCTESGWVVFAKCLDCGEIIDEEFEVPPTNHDFQEEIIQPTCTTAGSTIYKCTVCNYQISVDSVRPNGHHYIKEFITEPTCTTQGYGRYICIGCGDIGETFYTDVSQHSLYSTIVEPTCKDVGSETFKCNNCDYTYNININPLGHKDQNKNYFCDMCNEPVESEEFTEGLYTFVKCGNSAVIKNVDESISGDVVIPSSLGGYPVTAIGDEAFAYCYYITSVTVPEGVTTLGTSAFGCNFRLEEINLPESLEKIGNSCFALNISLQKIVIPNNVKNVDESAFELCIKLESITIPESVTTIGSYAFKDCMLLDKIVVKNPSIELGEYSYLMLLQPNGVTRQEWSDSYLKYATTGEISSQELEKITIEVESIEQLIYYATIYGYDPSTAKTYAEENGIQFKNISELDNEQNESTTVKDTETNVEIEFDSSAFETEVSLVVSEDAVNADIVFGDEYENYKAFDISIEANGEKVQPNGKVTVKLPLPEGFDAETTKVYYVDENGNKTKLESTTENGYIIFETDHFSEYVLVDESTKHEHSYTGTVTKEPICTEPGVKTFTCSCNDSYTEPVAATGHSHKAVTTAPTCTAKGYTTYTCSCGDSYVADYVNALGHKDTNGDYKCDNGCGYEFQKPAEPEVPSDPSENCSCNCHKGGFMGFIWKIINFFQKLFKANPVCACGAAHY